MSDYNDNYITNPYGVKAPAGVTYKQGYHTGADYVLPSDNITPIRGGKVLMTGYDPKGWGNYVWITGDDGISTLYAHLKNIKVKKGDKVNTSTVLGLQGSTGQATGKHVHVEVRENPLNPYTAMDPADYIATGDYNKPDNFLYNGIDLTDKEGRSNFGDWLKSNGIRILFIAVAVLFIYLAIKSVFLNGR